ncbi:hypothetical protein INT43_005237 [Umbelopsis isabellina]|uniref:PH domain-containing protein n=1 Tax=Mortierella isabellina TaxID=91625 RepID=A0A8H7PH04_MORIS|nr:hypothetical protein INT43_005237 [Umbelopsis isabellina]
METENPNPTNNAPLAIDTNVGHVDAHNQPGSANSQMSSGNVFAESPEAVGTYPPPSQLVGDHSEKTEVEDHTQAPPVFSALAPKLSITRRSTTSYQKQTFRMESGINPAETIAERLEAWRGVLKNLANVFKEMSSANALAAKGYTKSASLIELPFSDGGQHFREEGGIQTVWAATREYALEQSKFHHDYSMFLDQTVIQGLRSVKREAKTMCKSIRNDDRLKTETLYRYREQAEITQHRLNKYINLVNTAPDHANEKADPYIISCELYIDLQKLVHEENRLHDSMLNLQKEFAIFERQLVDNTRNVLRSFQDYRTDGKILSDHTVHMIMDTFDKLEADCEYKVFSVRRQGELVPENAGYKNPADITFENQHHPLVQPIKTGYLERRTFVTKNWSEHRYILTPTGYLHEYKNDKDFPTHPDVSIFIPQTTVTGKNTNMHQGYVFEIRGKNNSAKNKFMKSLERDKTYVLRARNGEDMQVWMDLMTPMSHQFRASVPHEPEDFQQPMNFTNPEVMSRASTWGSTTGGSHAGSDLQDRNLSPVASPTALSPTAEEHGFEDHGVERHGVDNSEHAENNDISRGVSEMSMDEGQAQEVPAGVLTDTNALQKEQEVVPEADKTEILDENNPFVDQDTSSSADMDLGQPGATQEESNQVDESQDTTHGGMHYGTAARIPVTLFDQSEPAEQTQSMPGAFTA